MSVQRLREQLLDSYGLGYRETWREVPSAVSPVHTPSLSLSPSVAVFKPAVGFTPNPRSQLVSRSALLSGIPSGWLVPMSSRDGPRDGALIRSVVRVWLEITPACFSRFGPDERKMISNVHFMRSW